MSQPAGSSRSASASAKTISTSSSNDASNFQDDGGSWSSDASTCLYTSIPARLVSVGTLKKEHRKLANPPSSIWKVMLSPSNSPTGSSPPSATFVHEASQSKKSPTTTSVKVAEVPP